MIKSFIRKIPCATAAMHYTTRITTILTLGSGLVLPLDTASAQAPDRKRLSAEWVQWALSIPTDVNPLTDETGEDCMVGQNGSIWFLAGTFFSSD